MGKRFNPNFAKINRNYTVEEVACLFGVHKNTVRQWIKSGLPLCDNKKPMLILGSVLRDFIRAKRTKNKRKCQLNEIYCVRCKLPQQPAGNMAEYEIISPLKGRLKALCPVCESIMNKYVGTKTLAQLQEQLEITMPKGL